MAGVPTLPWLGFSLSDDSSGTGRFISGDERDSLRTKSFALRQESRRLTAESIAACAMSSEVRAQAQSAVEQAAEQLRELHRHFAHHAAIARPPGDVPEPVVALATPADMPARSNGNARGENSNMGSPMPRDRDMHSTSAAPEADAR